MKTPFGSPEMRHPPALPEVWGLTIYESDKLRRNGVLNRRKEACHCKNVTYGMIEDAIRNGANTLQQVMDATGAGKGCGKCKEFLAYLIRDIQEERKNG